MVGPTTSPRSSPPWTGIPAGRMMEGETAKLLRMEESLQAKVIGQREAVAAVAGAVRRRRAGIADPDRPTAASCSSARPASARPSWPRRWPGSSSTTSGRWSAST
jgi:ATP-dependent Clp protease ATP-binding subunit ClpB